MERYNNSFDAFIENRSILISKLESGQLTKKEFLDRNYDLMKKMNIKPFLRIDNYEMGLFNYQYYNVLAKYFMSLAKEYKNIKKKQRQYRDYLNKGNNYYHEKDKAVLKLLDFLDYKNVEAYYINLNSKSLNDKLYEIVLLDYKEAIFHSKSIWLLDALKDKGVFLEDKKPSLIDQYINETY